MRIVFLATALGVAGQALAERAVDRLVATHPGPLYGTPDGGEGELLAFDPRLAPALITLAEGERIAVDGWPVAPSVFRTMVLTRTDVYAPDARIIAIGADGETEVPRSRWTFFQGRDVSGSARAAVAVDPDTGTMRGLVRSERGLHELLPPDVWTGGRHRLAAPERWDTDGTPRTWKCAEEDLPLAPSGPLTGAAAREPLAVRTPLAAFTKYAIVAIDTDNEFMNLKFANNTTNATNYIANLFNQMNLIYERDVQLHLLQGYTILRLSSVADPYLQNSLGNVSSAELNEFGAYWGANYSGVKRMLAALLSGKQPSNNSASGRAWIGGLCNAGFGYSFSKVFKFLPDTSAWDVLITAHEIGHNFGSPHTHCYADPKPDICYNGEPCYSGPTSCPAPVVINGYTATGTLMSYCHISPCNSSSTLAFHPETLSRYINSNISAASACIFNGAVVPTGPAVTGIVPSTGLIGGATPVTINGSGFVSGATAAFIDLTGSVSLTSVVFVNFGQLTAVTPAHAAGVMDVVVFNPDNSTGTLRNDFTYSAALPPPTVSTIAPNNGSTLGGTAVTITGTSFVNGATVAIGGIAATGVSFVNATTLTATTGAHATGTVNVVVTNPDAQTGTLANGYFYVAPAASTAFYTVPPCRVLDTRNANGPLGGPALSGSGARRTFNVVASACGIPASAKAVSVNMAVTQPAAGGSLTLYPGNGIPTGTTSINFSTGQTRANNAMLYLATDGAGSFGVENDAVGSVHFILDVNGYFQ